MKPLPPSRERKWDTEPFVARVTFNPDLAKIFRGRHVLMSDTLTSAPEGFVACFCRRHIDQADRCGWLNLPVDLIDPQEGDVVRVSPRAGDVTILYRRNSRHNAIFLTSECNCRCLLCPQPPCRDDVDWSQVWLDAIPLLDPATKELGITGGEPTVRPRGLLSVMTSCRGHLPQTALHVLSNGRMFTYTRFCRDLAAVRHQDLMIGIPLYSDLPNVHNHLMQCDGAFDQTVRGIMNLERYGIRVELRTVLCRPTVSRLVDLARFVARNLPFVKHFALMGLEPIGLAKRHLEELWLDPSDFQENIEEAVWHLAVCKINVSIYNLQLCNLRRSLWQFARRSITDWKERYLDECDTCSLRHECSGFFESAVATKHAQTQTVAKVS
jgi:His-Xaa-Ser system radical SAM maturase HxsC